MIANRIISFVTESELIELNNWVNSSVEKDVNLIDAKFKTKLNDYEYRTARGNAKATYPQIAFDIHSRFEKWVSKYHCILEIFPSGMPFTFVSYGIGSQAFMHLDPKTDGYTVVRFNILLNDDFKGGCFGIMKDELQILNIEKGDLHFYSATRSKHGVSKVTKGRRNIMLMSVLVRDADYEDFEGRICAENPLKISSLKMKESN